MANQRKTRHPGLTILLTIACLLLGGVYVSLSGPRSQAAAQATTQATESPDEALKQLRATEDARLTTYGWLDRENGVVHIPIDRAIDMVLQRGLPTRKQAQWPEDVF
jgi:hypothetical protein